MEQIRFDLTGQVALVTGAGKGIGHDLALALAGAGAKVAATGKSAADVEAVAAEVRDAGGEAAAIALDLRDRRSIDAGVQAAIDRFGRLDILVNNAGLGTNHDALEATEEEWDDLFAVNVRGLFFASQAAGRHMVARRYGRIVNLSSQAGLVGIARHAAYGASKGAVNLLTKVPGPRVGPVRRDGERRRPDLRPNPRHGRAPGRPGVRRRRPFAHPGRPCRHHVGRRGGGRVPCLPGRRDGHRLGAGGGRRLDRPVKGFDLMTRARPLLFGLALLAATIALSIERASAAGAAAGPAAGLGVSSDFNGDGFADLAVGVAFEDDGDSPTPAWSRCCTAGSTGSRPTATSPGPRTARV